MNGSGTFAVTSNMVLTAVYISAGDARWQSFQELWDVLLAGASATAAADAIQRLLVPRSRFRARLSLALGFD